MNNETTKRACEVSENFDPPAKKCCIEKHDAENVDKVDTDLTKDASNFPSEVDVGITEYISKLPGFSAVIKERYSDFIVNEIDLDGNVIKFTEISEPEDIPLVLEKNELTESQVQELKSLSANSDSSASVSINVDNASKETRTQIHFFIKKHFPDLVSKTVDNSSEKLIVVQKERNKKQKKHIFDSKGRGNYIHFVMYKENKDTMDAIYSIATELRVNSKLFSYAGTKDKRGKTAQIVSAFKISPQKLLLINRMKHVIRVGNIVYKDKEVKLGDLFGNKFVIILRQLKGDLSNLEEVMKSLSQNGFINYYGMQRFGTTSVPTHRIGRELLLNNWSEAIDLILQPRLGSYDKFAECRKTWMETRNANDALAFIKAKKSVEYYLLRGLASHNRNDLVNALNAIPRNMRLLYIHSYQSYVWNKVVSRRIAKFGLKVLVGDLIMKEEDSGNDDDYDAEELLKKTTFVTEDMVNQDGLIYSIVLPLPGTKVVYPNNEIKSWYEEILAESGMNFNSFQSNVKCYCLSGAYRKIIVRPSDMTWEVIPYNDNNEPLALSDWDIFEKAKLSPPPTDAMLKALKMEFNLPSSCYATMAIREVTKFDTSVYSQKTMNTNSS